MYMYLSETVLDVSDNLLDRQYFSILSSFTVTRTLQIHYHLNSSTLRFIEILAIRLISPLLLSFTYDF